MDHLLSMEYPLDTNNERTEQGSEIRSLVFRECEHPTPTGVGCFLL
ncbi:hypothetical protein SAMN05444487_1262 [Marininema mesophilum]|uniref:Uncharacterized protein n=1 Tax=Marininema mesophilum TaxID=1048340 RepID=A0A1H3CQU8_9BACL|nr:hypothetical protein SAMN05444487_1262 [Marininema mesophilum]